MFCNMEFYWSEQEKHMESLEDCDGFLQCLFPRADLGSPVGKLKVDASRTRGVC